MGISYYNSRKGFENPEDLNFDKITAQITASITKPSPVRLVKSVPTKQQQDDEALVDMIEKMDKEKIDKTTVDSEEIIGKDDVESPVNEKVGDPTLMTLSQKFEDMGFESLDKLVKKK